MFEQGGGEVRDAGVDLLEDDGTGGLLCGCEGWVLDFRAHGEVPFAHAIESGEDGVGKEFVAEFVEEDKGYNEAFGNVHEERLHLVVRV